MKTIKSNFKKIKMILKITNKNSKKSLFIFFILGFLTEVINISGNARSADRLNSYGGSGIHPVYFNKEGIPVECDYSIEHANEGDINSLFFMS